MGAATLPHAKEPARDTARHEAQRRTGPEPAPPAGQPVEVVRPWCEALLAIWGARRLLWGSDWPVLELAGNGADWRHLTLDVLRKRSPQEQADVLGGNARRIYRL